MLTETKTTAEAPTPQTTKAAAKTTAPNPVIFLDIDGVLNNTASTSESIYLLPEKARLVEMICHQSKARVVITSDWRMFMLADEAGGICPLRFALFRIGFPAKQIIGKTDDGGGGRNQQIDRWLMANKPAKWIIIDDEDRGFDDVQKARLIKTSIDTGLTLSQAMKAIKLLTT